MRTVLGYVCAEGGIDGLLERDGEAVLEALRGLPGGSELLELARDRPDLELIGGATRDLLLGRSPRELDVVLAGDVAAGGHASSPRGSAATADGATMHERFGTATVSWPQGRIDIATRRGESYAAPGALPDVRAGTAEEDLARRDFTINAIAVASGRARARNAADGSTRTRGSQAPAASACSTSEASSTIPRVCCDSRATARGSDSSSSRGPPSSHARRSQAGLSRPSPAPVSEAS